MQLEGSIKSKVFAFRGSPDASVGVGGNVATSGPGVSK